MRSNSLKLKPSFVRFSSLLLSIAWHGYLEENFFSKQTVFLCFAEKNAPGWAHFSALTYENPRY